MSRAFFIFFSILRVISRLFLRLLFLAPHSAFLSKSANIPFFSLSGTGRRPTEGLGQGIYISFGRKVLRLLISAKETGEKRQQSSIGLVISLSLDFAFLEDEDGEGEGR